MEPIVEIMPLPQAVRRFGQKSPVASALNSAQWEAMPTALREAAQFSAGVEDLGFVSEVQEKVGKAIGLTREAVKNGEAFVDRSSFIGDLKKLAAPLSNSPNPFADRGVTNLASTMRLGLIFDMQVQRAQGFARWKMDNDSDVLDAFPAQELIREVYRRAPRDWNARWQEAGGAVAWQGALRDRMVALKTSPIWTALSRFKTPWPPFDWGSGMGLRDVARAQAEEWGLIERDAPVEPTAEQDFNAGLQAEIARLTPAARDALRALFGDQIRIEGDTMSWKGAA